MFLAGVFLAFVFGIFVFMLTKRLISKEKKKMINKVIKEYNFKNNLKFEIRSPNNEFKSNPDQLVISKKSLININSLLYY